MTDQEIRLKFGEMNAGEMRLARALVAWHEREIAKLKEGLAEAQQIAESWSKHIHPATHDSIVSTKDEEIAALKAERDKWEADALRYCKNAEFWSAERDKAQAAVAEMNQRLIERTRDMLAKQTDLIQEARQAKREARDALAELASLRQPIQSDVGISLGQVAFDAWKKRLGYVMEWEDRNQEYQEAKEISAQAVADVVTAQAIRRMEEVPWRELKHVNYEAVRARLIAAVKGEGQQPIKGLEGLTKERCLRIAEVEGDSTIAAGRPDVCPHAAPHVFCETCKASPCPIGIPAKREGQAKPVVVNEPDLSGESEKPAQPWTPAVGDTVRLKSGGPPMTVTHVDPLSLMCAWMNADNELQVEPITTLCLEPAKP